MQDVLLMMVMIPIVLIGSGVILGLIFGTGYAIINCLFIWSIQTYKKRVQENYKNKKGEKLMLISKLFGASYLLVMYLLIVCLITREIVGTEWW